MSASLVFENVDAYYGTSQILHGVSFEVLGGTVTCLLGLNGMGKTTTLRTAMGLVDRQEGRIILDGKELKGATYHDFVYGHSNKAEFAKVPGIKIVGEAGRPLGTADWSSAISQIQASSADGVYLALAVGDDLTAFVNQLRGFGINHSLIVPVGIPDSMLQALGKNGVGMVTGGLTASWTQENSNPQVAEFVKAYVAKYKVVPGYQAINAYAGMQLTLAALNAASDMSTDSVIKALESTTADTVLGKLKIRKEDHQAMIGSYIAEAQALPTPKYGASVAWKTATPIGWEQIKYNPTDLGCKGL